MKNNDWDNIPTSKTSGRFWAAGLVLVTGFVIYTFFIGLSPTQTRYMNDKFDSFGITNVKLSYSLQGPKLCSNGNGNDRGFVGEKDGERIAGAFCWDEETTQGGLRFYRN